MDWIRTLLSRCGGLFQRQRLDSDLDDELRAHIDLAIQENLALGMSSEKARTAALRSFGGVTQTREEYRLQRGVPFLEHLARDLRFALRQLRNSPGFTVTAVLTLALGIGANSAMFSVVEGVLLAPLPYDHPDRLVMIWENRKVDSHIDISDISYPDFLDWRRNDPPFEKAAALTWHHVNLTSPGAAENLQAMETSSGFFATLGLKLTLGRELSASEDRENGSPVVIISERLWKDRFASSPRVLGQSVTLEGTNYTIIGVAPPRFRFWLEPDIYTSLARNTPKILMERSVHGIAGVARLKPGLSLTDARGQLSSLQQNLDRLYPKDDAGIGIDLVPIQQQMVGDVRPTLLLLLGAVGLVLLIACANFANLLLARSAARTRELGLRAALGATRARIVRQLLTESLLLSIAGGLLGLAGAEGLLRVVLNSVRDTLPRAKNISINLPVLLFTFGVVVGVGILFGAGPAIKSSKLDMQKSLKAGGHGSTSARHRAQSTLVVIQMALTLVLLVGSGLLLRTIQDLLSVNPGFDAHEITSFRIGLSPSFTKSGPGIRLAFQQLLERIRHIPGVQAADLTNVVPLDGGDNSGPFWLGTNEPASPQDAPHALYFWTGTDYLKTMKIPLLEGRFFTLADNVQSDRVIAIDSNFARTYFPGRSPLGETVTVAHWGTARIVGVVGHVRHWGLNDPSTNNRCQIYIPLYELPDYMTIDFVKNSLTVLVRSPLNSTTLMQSIRGLLYGSDADDTIFAVEPLEEIVAASMSTQRLAMLLLSAFALLALVLASVGTYGVISYSVTQRVQEIGVRMALGASRRDVLRMILHHGLELAATGLVIGIVAVVILARVLASFSSLLYGVGASDPLTILAVAFVLACAALLASYVPARHASSIDPMRALRTE